MEDGAADPRVPTDRFCGSSKETIGRADWMVTFVISRTSDPSTVNVRRTSLVATKSSWGMSYNGSFTTDLMMGTWTHRECIVYCTGEYTKTKAMKLVRQ